MWQRPDQDFDQMVTLLTRVVQELDKQTVAGLTAW